MNIVRNKYGLTSTSNVEDGIMAKTAEEGMKKGLANEPNSLNECLEKAESSVGNGQRFDYPVLKDCIKTLKDFGVETEVLVCSAHRTPDMAARFASGAEAGGIK